MDDTTLFMKLLRITTPWRVTRVTVDVPAERIDVWVEETPGAKCNGGRCVRTLLACAGRR